MDASAAIIGNAAQELKQAGADLILGAGIPVLLSAGPNGNERVLKLFFEVSGFPAITTLSLAIDAIRHMEVKRVAIAAAYG